MAECSVSDLMAAAACFNCTTQRERAILKTALLCRLSAGACNIAELMAQASTSRFNSLTTKQRAVIETQLLCNISGGT